MKKYLLFTLLFVLPALAFSQNRTLNEFYRKHKRGHEVQNIKLPGWLIRFGGSIARMGVEEPEEKLAMELLRNFGPVRLMYTENGNRIPAKDIQNLRKDLLADDFDDLILIRDGQSNVQVMVRDQGEYIRNLFLLFNDGENGELVFFSAETNIHYNDLNSLLKALFKKELKPYFDLLEDEPLVKPII